MKIELNQFTMFFKEYQKRFVRFAINYVQNEEEAEDIVMEAMLAFWEHRYELPEDTNIPAYVLTSVKNKCLNYLKASRNALSDSIDEIDQWEIEMRLKALENFDPFLVYTREIQQIVENTLATLSPQTRRIFGLSRYDNFSNDVIAQITNLSVKSVEYHITKALKALKIALKDYLPVSIVVMMLQ